jgi:hypothetical protein
MDAFGLTILILMSLPCVNMLSNSVMLSIYTSGLFGVSRCIISALKQTFSFTLAQIPA